MDYLHPMAGPFGGPTSLALLEARVVQHATRTGFSGYATLNHRDKPGGQLHEIVFPVGRMAATVDRALREFRGHDVFLSQHSYRAGRRCTDALLTLNVGHVDLDTYKVPSLASTDPEMQAEAFVSRLRDEGLLLPSYIVWSGRGLQAKWVWRTPLPAAALPRWLAAHRCAIEMRPAFAAFGADKKAMLPTQILRLVGSQHSMSKGTVRVVWSDGDLIAPERREFDDFCLSYLPYTREQAREYKARAAAAQTTFRAWDAANAANRGRRASDQPGRFRRADLAKVAREVGLQDDALAILKDQFAGEIWRRRLNTMDSYIASEWGPDGVPKGRRSEWCYIAANAFSWVNGGQPQALVSDTFGWTQRCIPSYSVEEVLSAAGAVLRRVRVGEDCYRMSEPIWLEKLGVPGDDLYAAHAARPSAQKPRNRGALKYDTMRLLPYETYVEEMASRQAAGGRYAAEVRPRKRTSENETTAVSMRANGATLQAIADELGVHISTIKRWLA